MPSLLTLVGGLLRVNGCGGPLVVSNSAQDPCCCGRGGCTNPNSPNYDAEAVCDDGSCITCCNQGRCIINDESPCKGANCNGIDNGCCDYGCLPCEGTGRDCSNTFDNSFTPTRMCGGQPVITYHDCFSCPQQMREQPDGETYETNVQELQQILESQFGGPYVSADERRQLTLLPETVNFSEHPTGPGTVLARVFSLFGIYSSPKCLCRLRAHVMNVMGCKWCLLNLRLITTWLEQESKRRGIPYTRGLGVVSVFLAVLVSSALRPFSRRVYG